MNIGGFPRWKSSFSVGGVLQNRDLFMGGFKNRMHTIALCCIPVLASLRPWFGILPGFITFLCADG